MSAGVRNLIYTLQYSGRDMTILPLGSFGGVIFGWLMSFLSVFLVLLILIQRGKGGGLTGALGGPGGQSAFGSKAGDTFTLITVVVASLWGFVCAVAILVLSTDTATPSVASDTRLSAGPGDEDNTIRPTDSLIIPSMGGLSDGQSTAPQSTPADSGETPSMDLTPAIPSTPADPSTDSADSATESEPVITE